MTQLDLRAAADPSYLASLGELSMDEVRAKRDACSQLETELSYLRRLAQARVDLIVAEAQRRDQGAPPETPEELVGRLGHILGDRSRASGPGRLPSIFAPAQVVQADLEERVEQILPSDRLGSLAELPAPELDELLKSLSALEREVSGERRTVHDIIDRLQEEIVRRYRNGEATVDTLLRLP